MDPVRRALLTGRRSAAAERGAPVVLDAACLARHGVECRLCGDACDARVIRFVPQRGGLALPALDLARCTACGDCVPVCPVNAISVSRVA